VQHNRYAYACAKICRAGGEIAESGTESVIDLLLNQVVDVVNLFCTVSQLQAAFDYLNAEVVFFVNHSGERFFARDAGASRAFAEGVMPAYEIPLDKKMPFDFGGIGDAKIKQVVAEVEGCNNGFQNIEYFGFFLVGAMAHEFSVRKIPRQPDARGYHYVG
jgi:hypothetical protein